MADRDDRRGADGERGSAGEAGKGGGAGGGKGGRPGRKGEGRGRKGGRPGRKGGAGRKGDRPGRRGGGPRGKGVRAPGRRGPARGRPAGPRPIVAVFAKAPEPGRVKTRLTPALHAQEAADLHRALLQDTVERAERSGAETVVAFAPADARRPLERLLGRHRRLVPQGPGDLGARLDHTFERLCDGRRPVVVVGSDCPSVDEARLRQAFDALRRADVVVGPALDGGYYLIGAKERRPELFRDVPWGTERVLEATRARIEAAGLEAAWLPAARDLDTPADLFEWYAGARAAKLRERYPRTWSVLHSILPPRRFSALEAAVRGDEAG